VREGETQEKIFAGISRPCAKGCTCVTLEESQSGGALWNSGPFEPLIKDGKIYARGSADDKAPIIAMLAAVDAIRAAGLNVVDSDKLIAFRIHGVSPEMVRSLKQAGYEPDADKLIAMRIHGATPEWVADLKKQGYDHVDLDKLIAFRIHGVSSDFIGQLQKLGYSHPEPDQLIAMRIHGVTPDFITGLQSRGMKNLTIEQLVSLRIHGID